MQNLEDVTLDSYTEADLAEFEALIAGGVAAVFIYNNHILSGGKRFDIDEEDYRVRPEFKDGMMYVPECVFERLDGGRVEKNTVFVGENALKYEAGGRKYTAQDLSGEFSGEAYSRFGHVYLPLAEAAAALGLSSVALYEGRLAVFGAAETVVRVRDAARSNPALE